MRKIMVTSINNNLANSRIDLGKSIIDLKESRKTLKAALDALETIRSTISLKITNVERKYQNAPDSQPILDIVNNTISKKEEIVNLKKAVSSDEVELNGFIAGIDEMTEKKKVIDSYIKKFNEIKDSKPNFSELFSNDSSKIKKIKSELPKEYHVQTLEEVNSLLTEDLNSILEVITDLKSACDELKQSISEKKKRSDFLEKSIPENYKSESLADLKERKKKLERKLKFSLLKNDIDAQADKELRKLKLDLCGTDREIKEKRDELNKIDGKLRELRHSRANAAKLLKINNEVENAESSDINDKDGINTDKAKNKSLTRWEAFKSFILSLINVIRNLFRSPYSA